MSMTKRDYQKFADLIRTQGNAHQMALFQDNSFVYALCDLFKADNERFDRAAFLEACGMEEKSPAVETDP